MGHQEGYFRSPVDGTPLATYRWGSELVGPIGIVQLVHGLAEHSACYDEVADALVSAGYVVVAHDHRGHGHTATSPAELGDFGPGGFAAVIADVAAFSSHLADQCPGLPLYILGHAMGSYAVQHVLLDHSRLFAGAILTGSAALDVLATALTSYGELPHSFAKFNVGYGEPAGLEWMSRDPAALQRYRDDPLCGFALAPATMPELLTDVGRLSDPHALAQVDPALPVLLMSGREDPLSGDGQLVALLAQRYRSAGLHDVTMQVLPGARHSLFREVNRAEVVRRVIDWLHECQRTRGPMVAE